MIFPQSAPRVAGLVSRHDFVLEGLAPDPSAGLPLGNGEIAASLFGGPGLLALRVRKNDAHIGDIRLHIPGHESRTPRPATPDPRPATVLGLYDATARASLLEGIEVEAFVAAARELIILRVRSRRGDSLPAALELASPGPASQFRCDGPFRYARQDPRDGSSAALCGFVYGARSRSEIRADAVVAAFAVPPFGECLILTGVAGSAVADPVLLARAEVERALPLGHLLLQREHAVSWERFWSTLEDGDPETTDYRDIYSSRVTPRAA